MHPVFATFLLCVCSSVAVLCALRDNIIAPLKKLLMALDKLNFRLRVENLTKE